MKQVSNQFKMLLVLSIKVVKLLEADSHDFQHGNLSSQMFWNFTWSVNYRQLTTSENYNVLLEVNYR